MKPPTEAMLNEEVDNGSGLHLEGEPSYIVQGALDILTMELDTLEITMEMTSDRWKNEEDHLLAVIRHYNNSLEFEMEWQDEVDPVTVAAEQDHLKEAEEKLATKREEFEEGREKMQENLDHKKRQILVVKDVLRRTHNGHF